MKLERPSDAALPFRAQVHRAWARLRGGELTPARAGWSVALGLFVGTQPTPGLHLPIVVGLCLPLRLDAAVCYLAANISIPPIAPILWFAAIQIGARLVTGQFVPVTVAAARDLFHAPRSLVAALCLGAVVLGAVLGAIGGLATFVVARMRARARVARESDPLEGAIVRTAERYAASAHSRGTYYYVRGKLRGDPSTRAVAALAPLGSVLDLGCGRGQLAVLLLEAGAATRVRGCDWDASKVALANRSVSGIDAAFVQGDVRSAAMEPADTVLLVDVLHYFDRATQDALLLRAADLVAAGGRLVVREADVGRGWRSAMTRIEEGFFTAIRFNRGERVLFRNVAHELVPLLEARGMHCEVVPCWGSTPFSNVLLVARREA